MIPYQRACICMDCNYIVQPLTAGGLCPHCLSRALLPIAKVLDRAGENNTAPSAA